MKNFLCFTLIAIACIQPSAFAEETNIQNSRKTLNGVWKAAVNQQKLFVCLADHQAYAYNTQNLNELIELSPAENSNDMRWKWHDSSGEETASKPFLTLNEISAHQITADIQYGVKTTTRIILKRIKTSNNSGDCLFDDYNRKVNDVSNYQAFNAPRVKALKTWESAPSTFIGKQYRTKNAATRPKSRTGGKVSVLNLLSDTQDMSAVNKTLAQYFVSDKLSLVTCGDDSATGGGDFHAHQKLRYWGSKWVSISYHSDGYCGGAHPFFNADTQTFNIATGKSEDIWQWFKLTTLDRKAEIAEDEKQICRFKVHKDEYLKQCLPPKLVRKIYRARTICDEKCRFSGEKAIDFREATDGHIYSASLSPHGVIFLPSLAEPARGMRTYFAHYVIPYAELKPFLSKKGREEINKIIQMGSEEAAAVMQ